MQGFTFRSYKKCKEYIYYIFKVSLCVLRAFLWPFSGGLEGLTNSYLIVFLRVNSSGYGKLHSTGMLFQKKKKNVEN